MRTNYQGCRVWAAKAQVSEAIHPDLRNRPDHDFSSQSAAVLPSLSTSKVPGSSLPALS